MGSGSQYENNIIVAQVIRLAQTEPDMSSDYRFDTCEAGCYIRAGVITGPEQVQFWFVHLFRLDIAMNVGMCKINLRLPENLSLKGKRQVLKSITSRVRNKFNVSVAEVDNQDRWQIATIGICCVSNENRHANEVLSKVVDFVISSRFEAEILDYEIEIMPVW